MPITSSETSNNFVKCTECGMTFWIDISSGPMFGWNQIQRSHATYAGDHTFRPEWIIRGSVSDFRPSDPDSVASTPPSGASDGGRLDK